MKFSQTRITIEHYRERVLITDGAVRTVVTETTTETVVDSDKTSSSRSGPLPPNCTAADVTSEIERFTEK